ncbi:hypothetical protein QMA66_01215 [Leuconostoc suionicum]|uniref:hypothetical protein n=1 Tax=Leuconostoc suionicum TaxID=1511761 RepID=UPI0024AE1A98|nr:hypothetical protein [Leuconostoc suionicum]MDI6497123.1 hypothetical protein [Leuconostoc suionicum]
MAISINSILINEKNFTLQGRNLKAVYTPEVDNEFSDFLIDMGELEKKMSDKKLDDLNVDEKKKKIRQFTNEINDLSSKYIKALFNKDDADYIFEKAGGRVANLARLARAFFDEGNDDVLVKQQGGQNRKQRRNKGNE